MFLSPKNLSGASQQNSTKLNQMEKNKMAPYIFA